MTKLTTRISNTYGPEDNTSTRLTTRLPKPTIKQQGFRNSFNNNNKSGK